MIARKPRISDSVTLWDYQQESVERIIDWYKHPDKYLSEGIKQSHYPCVSPTGTGKSYIGLMVHELLWDEGGWLITPKLEIIVDLLTKLNVALCNKTVQQLIDIAFQYRICTPLRFKNLILSGKVEVEDIRYLIKDENHHDEADTYKFIDALVDEGVRFIGTTATHFRGTPKGTQSFFDKWGKPQFAITLPDAVKRGFLSFPKCQTWPLVDDDLIEVGKNGEFVVNRVVAEVSNNLEHALCRMRDEGIVALHNATLLPTRPTLIGIPSSSIVPQLETETGFLRMPIGVVTDETTYAQRQRLFKMCLECKLTLVHINVVSEGVDLGNKTAKLRNYVDLAPVNSPLLFMQRFGRITRQLLKTETEPGNYICTNRNLERHGYLFSGVLPYSTIKESQTAFTMPSERTKTRVFGLQTLGRLKPTNVVLSSGVSVQCYHIATVNGTQKTEYLVLIHPAKEYPLWLKRERSKTEEVNEYGVKLFDFGTWEIEQIPPSDLQGFKSSPPYPLREGQQKLWQKHAENYGLLTTQKLDAKKFQILPALMNVRRKLS